MVRCVTLHISNFEAWRQIYDDLGRNILYSAGAVLTLNGRITASDYVDILDSQVHPMVQVLFPINDAVFPRWRFAHTHT
jgi:hypothetical protein